MIVLITYDISDDKIRTNLHAFLKDFGVNTQKSVFECDLDLVGGKMIRQYCRENIDLGRDSVRIYKICNRCIGKVQVSGLGLKILQLDYAIV